MRPRGLSVNRLAMDLQVPVTRVNEIVRRRRAITTDKALRLARYFRTTKQLWISLQANYDLEPANHRLSERINSEVNPRTAA